MRGYAADLLRRGTLAYALDGSRAAARQNGLKEEELVEAITHLAFYAGWPNAVGAVAVAREVFGKK
jgi:alkylhydroperoxidase/carboxymuconolactone decarboxylase family protein YurZ